MKVLDRQRLGNSYYYSKVGFHAVSHGNAAKLIVFDEEKKLVKVFDYFADHPGKTLVDSKFFDFAANLDTFWIKGNQALAALDIRNNMIYLWRACSYSETLTKGKKEESC